MDSEPVARTNEIRTEVRRAVARLEGLDRRTIEGYYFDGMSMGQIASKEGVSTNRVVMAHRQALRQLRQMLAPLVARWYGIGVIRNAACAICTAAWREAAEAIIDAKTQDVTWGQTMTRIERATGWRAKSPQALIMHQRKHRTFQPEGIDNGDTSPAWGACIEDQHLGGAEDEFGAAGKADGPPVGGCLQDFIVDESADHGGLG